MCPIEYGPYNFAIDQISIRLLIEEFQSLLNRSIKIPIPTIPHASTNKKKKQKIYFPLIRLLNRVNSC